MHAQYTFPFGRHSATLETGLVAKQSTAAVQLTVDDTVILATVVISRAAKPGMAFLPLTVDYVEKGYAAGRIPGNALRREGPLSENEILTSRLIDRAIRPLFPDGFHNEVQVVVQVLSSNPEVDPEIPSLIAAAAALHLSGAPVSDVLGAVRVGRIDGQLRLNPGATELKASDLDLVIAGSKEGVLMVEAGANQLAESSMLEAIAIGQEAIASIVAAIEHFGALAQRTDMPWQAPATNSTLEERIGELASSSMDAAYAKTDRERRDAVLTALKSAIRIKLAETQESETSEEQIDRVLADVERTVVRRRILRGETRMDGRDAKTVRPLAMRTAVLPRTHGSALFTRGDTQSLAVATLGDGRDAQLVRSLQGTYQNRFMLHYNMPPFATGEAGRFGTPKRREIGHGRLAKRALESVLPGFEEFPYTVRVVSEITESNGSSSMASVCGGCLALLDAGVPLKGPVAGIAMGLVSDGVRHAVLTDILGDEDHLGDMDFKVAGTEHGITALQMDIKMRGVALSVLGLALEQAREARLHILGQMRLHIDTTHPELSSYAPRAISFKINPERIGAVIGPGGASIRALTQETGTSINVEQDGTVSITGPAIEQVSIARERIEALADDLKIGEVYQGVVQRLLDFGAIVTLRPGQDGLLHMSQIPGQPVAGIAEVLKVGETVQVQILEQDARGRLRLSMRGAQTEASVEGV
jgi:polyribonucleotide nucleotidyltransferase